jgi:hypothetical protein
MRLLLLLPMLISCASSGGWYGSWEKRPRDLSQRQAGHVMPEPKFRHGDTIEYQPITFRRSVCSGLGIVKGFDRFTREYTIMPLWVNDGCPYKTTVIEDEVRQTSYWGVVVHVKESVAYLGSWEHKLAYPSAGGAEICHYIYDKNDKPISEYCITDSYRVLTLSGSDYRFIPNREVTYHYKCQGSPLTRVINYERCGRRLIMINGRRI